VSGGGYTNIFGRKPGRGIRPWLLIPTVISVAIFIGSLTTTCVIWFTSGYEHLPVGSPERAATIKQVSMLIRALVVPALLCVILFGVLLLLQHPRQFLRLRWLVVKLTILVVITPAAHVYLFSCLAMLRETETKGVGNNAASDAFGRGLIAALIVYVVILILGRLKPRLGQNIAATSGHSTVADGSSVKTS
jgi:uncharacterized membrane protein